MKLAVRYGGKSKVIGELPKGDDGITATIAGMQCVVDHAVNDPQTKPMLDEVVRHVRAMAGSAAWKDVADELWKWCRRRVRFRKDPEGVELMRHPYELFFRLARSETRTTSGDCDDLAVFGASVLAVAGLTPVLVTVGTQKDGRFKHVFFGVRYRTRNVLNTTSVYPLDPQENTPAGTWPKYAERVKLWSLTVTEPG